MRRSSPVRPGRPLVVAVARAARLGLALGMTLLLCAAVRAVEPQSVSVDGEFLEYIGGGDDVEPEMQQYLVHPRDEPSDDAKPAPQRGSVK